MLDWQTRPTTPEIQTFLSECRQSFEDLQTNVHGHLGRMMSSNENVLFRKLKGRAHREM
jgi:hypothetical protein